MRNRPSSHFFEALPARREILLLRLRPAEKAFLRELARRQGLSMSELCRRRIASLFCVEVAGESMSILVK